MSIPDDVLLATVRFGVATLVDDMANACPFVVEQVGVPMNRAAALVLAGVEIGDLSP